MNREELIFSLQRYHSAFAAERDFVPRFISLLRNFKNCYRRELTTGHITGSAWIVDEAGTQALLVKHKKLNRWLQPGGHADGQEDIRAVAMKEATEETGLRQLQLYHSGIYDFDIHLIPGNKMAPAHLHYDVRFLFVADVQEQVKLSEESHALAWVAMEKIPFLTQNSESIHRMILKSKSIF